MRPLIIKFSLSFFLILFSFYLALAQRAIINFDGHVYTLEKVDANHIIDAEHRLNNLVLTIKLPSEIKKGLFNSIQLSTVGIELGNYPIGKDALAKIQPNEDPDNLGTGVVSLSWFASNGERLIIASDMGYMESCSGSIYIMSWTKDRVSGRFDVVLNGNQLTGSFDNVSVKGLHE